MQSVLFDRLLLLSNYIVMIVMINAGSESRWFGTQAEFFLWSIYTRTTPLCTLMFSPLRSDSSGYGETRRDTQENWPRSTTSSGTLQDGVGSSNHNQMMCIARHHPHSSYSSPPTYHPIQFRSSHCPLQILLGTPHILRNQRKPYNPFVFLLNRKM
jgi:hypothetical protein